MKWWALVIALAFSAAQNSPEGRGSIAGIVERSSGGSPIADVSVRLWPIPLSSADSSASHESSVMTDDSGRFEFKDLIPGRYRVYWERDGYFPPAWGPGTSEGFLGIGVSTHGPSLNVDYYSGARKPPDRNVLVDVSPGQVQNLRLPLVPGGVITGHVLDERGRPLAGGSLTALRVIYESGIPILLDSDSVASNERGDFRFFGLQPGRYYIRYDNRRSSGQDGVRYSYFPGVGTASAASAVNVSAGGESRGVNFSVMVSPRVKISGTVTITVPSFKLREYPVSPEDANSTQPGIRTIPPFLDFFLIPADGSSPLDPLAVRVFSSNSTMVDSLVETFELPGVHAGEYDLYTILHNEDPSETRAFVARSKIRVGTEDIRNLAIKVGTGSSIEGRVVMQDGTSALTPGMEVYAGLTPKAAIYPIDLGSWNTAKSDGTFRLSGIDGQHYAVTLRGLPPNLAVVDVRQAGRSVYDEGIVTGAKEQPIEIVVSKNAGSIDVRIVDAVRQPVNAGVVALVPMNDHLQNWAFYRRAEFDEDKPRYHPFEGIPPGEYVLYAWDDIPDGAEQNAEFLHQFEGRGVRVVVGPGAHLNIEVPLIMNSN